jgi:uncharacterized protein (DUF2384 family)
MATSSIADVLGGEMILGRPVNKGGALAELVRDGLPVKALLRLAERLDIRQAEASEKVGIPRRTLTRRRAQNAWLKTPNRTLRGGRPLDQLDTDPGVREVEDILGRISYGIYS